MTKKIFLFAVLILGGIWLAVYAPARWEPGLSFWYQLGFPFIWKEDAFSDLGYGAVHSRNYTLLILNLLINLTSALAIGFTILFLKKKFWKK